MALTSSIKPILGCMTFGGQVNEEDSNAMMSYFFEHTTAPELDTAYVYSDGKTEEVMGKMLTEQQRQKMFIATKVNPRPGGFTPENIRKQFDTSLARLKLQHVDLLYLHVPDHNNPILETLKTINELHKEGKFKELGLSNYSAWQVADIWHICNNNGWVKPTVYQGMYNVLTRNIEMELFPALRKFGLRFYVYNPIAGGLLSGNYNHETLPSDGRFGRSNTADMYKSRYWKQSYFSAIQHILLALDAHNKATNQNLTLLTTAYAWLIHHSQIKSVHGDGIILGASKMAHLEANLNYFKCDPLPEVIQKACDEAWHLCASDCANYYR